MSAEDIYHAAQSSAALFALSKQIVLFVHGPDALRYLHGRLTQDINKITDGHGAQSLLLNPQGKILGQCLVLKTPDGLLLIADPGSGEDAFLKDLLQFKVADQLEVDSLNNSHRLVALLGPASEEILQSLAGALPSDLCTHLETTLAGASVKIVRNKRGAPAGFDIIVTADDEAAVTAAIGEHLSIKPSEHSEQAFEMLRISAGIPQAGADLTEKLIATDIPIEHLVSFEKGCYAGQEVVEMSIARGRPNRQLLILAVAGVEEISTGAEVTSEGKKCGWATSSCFFPSQNESQCLAFIKTSVADDAPLVIADVDCRRV